MYIRQLLVICVAASAARGVRALQAPIPIRPLGPIVRTASGSLRSVNGIRVLSNGRVLVDDGSARRVLLYDSTLSHTVAVIDTASGATRAYGASYGRVLAYYGDSSLYVDYASMAMLVIGPDGTLGRTIAVPGASNMVGFLTLPVYGATFDYVGYFVYCRTAVGSPRTLGLQPGEERLVWSDSASVLRVNIGTRRIDTLAKLRTFGQMLWYSRTGF